MLGFKSLEEKLREDGGISARATVEQAKAGLYTTVNGDSHGFGGTDVTRYHYTVLVKPDEGDQFEAKVMCRVNHLNALNVGQEVVVLYDQFDHGRVALDVAATKQLVGEAWERRYAGGLRVIRPPEPAASPPPAPAPRDPLDELAKLADLKDRGAVTEAEYEAEKAKLLGE